MICVGTCGFPKARAEVFGKLQSVEIQDTFYRHVENATVRRWRSEAPEDFVFSVKASQLITHDPTSPTYRRSGIAMKENVARNYGSFKPTTEVVAAWRKSEETCRILKAKAVLFQTPPSFKPEPENIMNIGKFFMRAETKMMKIWEPRGNWPDDVVGRICSQYGLVHGVDPFAKEPATSDIAYFRLHGKPPGNRNYYYTYSEAELKRVAELCKAYGEAYIFFNNISMFDDAQRLRRLSNIQG